MADNVLPQFNRNYGAMVTAKEFWGGNNGFATVAVQMPSANYELAAGSAYEALAKKAKDGVASDAELIQVSNAQRNLFRVAQALSQRAVLVAISGCEMVETGGATARLSTLAVSGPNVLAGYVGGTHADVSSTAPLYFVTFMIERADALNKQENKPGATYALTIDPSKELVDNLTSVNFFESKTFTQDPDGKMTAGARAGAAAGLVKVFDALPVLK